MYSTRNNIKKVYKLIKDISLGVRDGLTVPLLPPVLEEVNGSLIVKNLKRIGMLCLGFINKKDLISNMYLFLVVLIICVTMSVYY